ncbi:MAG TPA: NADH-quinone oxidoreductase subunit N [Acidobacteriaceae bacterium]|nr:NADH-quinone oxidoreductase subunit N [Acidobacteriaceae bacterium]
MNAIHYGQLLQLAWPEIILTIAALIALAADLLFLRRSPSHVRFLVAASIASIGCIAAIFKLLPGSSEGALLGGVLLSNPATHLVQIALLVIAILTLFLSVDSAFTDHVGEFVLLILLATTGMMFLVASQDLLVIFISLELLSLSVYILAGFDKRSPRSSEAALKYFLFGGMSAAFMLFGFSLLYGFSNSTNLVQIANAIHGVPLNPLVILAIVTTVIGFGFKIAAAPFHFWAPDVYQGAPTPSAAFIASGSKVASFFIFFQVLVIGFAGAEGSATLHHFQSGWVPVIVAVAVVSMLLGNLVAITQTSLRRLLAYSAVAHAGYMLLAFVAHSEQSLAALLYYVATYALATLGIFGILAVTEKHLGNDKISGLAGLSRRAPFLSACLFIFVLSLAGIPPLSGFFAKFLLFSAVLAVSSGSKLLIGLIIFAIGMSAVSLYYYLRVLKSAFVADPPVDAAKVPAPVLMQLVIGLLAAGVVALGCAPDLILNQILNVIHASGL